MDGGLSTSIQLLVLDQSCVEDFVGHLAEGHACLVGEDKRISCCRGANETNYFMYKGVGPCASPDPYPGASSSSISISL